MQVRLDLGGDARVLFRTVPIAKASRLDGDVPWHAASEALLQDWVHSDSAVGRWLSSKGLHCEKPGVAAVDGILSLSLL
jgi:hypothetical protein